MIIVPRPQTSGVSMRGPEKRQSALFSYVSAEERIPEGHPLRVMRKLVEPILADLSPRFDALYSRTGRPSIPPEQLLKALLLQGLYSIRSERQLMEQLDYNILYRWFIGLNMDDAVWVPTVFTKNRERLMEGGIAEAFLGGVLDAANERGLLSHEHFTVDGTLLEAAASQKSFRAVDDTTRPGPPAPNESDESDTAPAAPGSSESDRKSVDRGRNPSVDFHGEKRSNVTHHSVTDPDARLAKKSNGTTARLCHLGSVLMDNRHGLVVATDVRPPGYDAELDAALEMLATLGPVVFTGSRRRTLGADKGYDRGEFVEGLRKLKVTPHVAQNIHARRRRSAVDARTTRHAGYEVSQRKRKRVEESFAWCKDMGLIRKLRHRGRAKVGWIFTFTNAVYNLVRIRTLIRAGACV